MSFPRYPKYKESGVEWLGEVPAHWTLPKLNAVTSFSGGGTPSRENLTYWNGEIPWVSPKDMKSERIIGTEESITAEGLQGSAATLLPPGCVLMVVRSGILKHTIPVAINEVSVTLNQDIKALRFEESRCLSRFFLRWVQGLNDQLLLVWAKQGATVESIEHAYLATTVIPLPSLAEQTFIADFLNRETAKIDELVAEQQRLIELLKEKRQAVISHAVTKGLNPHAPMKPSGIEWLGDIPAHWEVKRLKQLATNLTDGEHISPTLADEGIPLLSAKDVRDWQIDYNVDKFVSERDATFFWKRCKPEAGDLLVVSRGATVGRIGVVEEKKPFCLMGSVILCKLEQEFTAAFLYYALNASHAQTSFLFSSGSSAQQAIYIRDVADVPVSIPPAGERLAITSFLEKETAQLDTLTAEAERAIALLQERRTALISAAVTGQIDVRHLAENEIAA